MAPPYTVASLKSRIAKAEGIADREIQLFEDTDGEALMKDADRAPFLAETFPGHICQSLCHVPNVVAGRDNDSY